MLRQIAGQRAVCGEFGRRARALSSAVPAVLAAPVVAGRGAGRSSPGPRAAIWPRNVPKTRCTTCWPRRPGTRPRRRCARWARTWSAPAGWTRWPAGSTRCRPTCWSATRRCWPTWATWPACTAASTRRWAGTSRPDPQPRPGRCPARGPGPPRPGQGLPKHHYGQPHPRPSTCCKKRCASPTARSRRTRIRLLEMLAENRLNLFGAGWRTPSASRPRPRPSATRSAARPSWPSACWCAPAG